MPSARRSNTAGSYTGLPSPSDRALALINEGPGYAAPKGKPKAGEATGAQSGITGVPFPQGGLMAEMYGLAGGGSLGPGGGFYSLFAGAYPGLSVNICGGMFGFGAQGLIQPRKGSYATYRLMSLHPVLRLVRQLICAPILASQWSIKAADGRDVPDKLLDLVKQQILPLRWSILSEALRYLESGWRPFEKVWEIRDGQYWLKKLKPLLPDTSAIMHDGNGNFGALQAGADLPPNKSWIVTYDGEAGNLYGMSRHEAAFDAWIDWQYSRLRAAQLQGKLSGYLPILYFRPGTTKINGNPADNAQIAKQILASVGLGNGMAVPSTEFTDDDLQENPKLASASPWKLEIVDAGSYAPAVAGMISEREYHDKNLVRAWCWPERAVLEASHGGLGQGDSKSHGDAASLDRELIDDDIANQLSSGQPAYNVPGVVDDILELNAGEEWRGAVRITPAPLVDEKVAVYSDLLKAAYSNPQLATIFAKITDWEDVLTHLDIATPEDLKGKLNDVIKAGIDEQQQQAQANTEASQQQAREAVGKAGLAGKSNQVNVPRQVGAGAPKKPTTEEQTNGKAKK